MKQVLLSIYFLFLFCTLASAFHPQISLDSTKVFDHQIKPSYSSNIILPTDSYAIPHHTRSYPNGYKEPEIIPVNQYPYPVNRHNPFRCRQLHRFMRQPRRFESSFAPVQPMDVRVGQAVEAFVLQHRNVPEVKKSSVRVLDHFNNGPRWQYWDSLHPHDHDHDEDAESIVEVKEEYIEDKEGRQDEFAKDSKEKGYYYKNEDKDIKENDVVKKLRKLFLLA